MTSGSGSGARPRRARTHPNPGRPTLHRLNRAEYRNAIRDLLGLEIDAARCCRRHRWIRVRQQRRRADAVAGADGALPGAAAKSVRWRSHVRADPIAGDVLRADGSQPGEPLQRRSASGSRGGWRSLLLSADGEYLFELRPKRAGRTAASGASPRNRINSISPIDNVKVWTDRRRAGVGRQRRTVRARSGQEILEALEVPRAGEGRLASGSGLLRPEDDASSKTCSTRLASRSVSGRQRRAGISSVTITGPPPSGDGSAIRRAAAGCFVCQPASAADEDVRQKIISTLARRAHRRPVTEDDLQEPRWRAIATARGGAASSRASRWRFAASS